MTLVAPDGFDVEAAQRSLAAAMAPPTRPQLAQWLAILAAITVPRQRDALDEELIIAIYTERLSVFPADIVEHCLLRERWRFFPVLSEVEEACDRLVSRRRTVARLLADGRVRCGDQAKPPERAPRASHEDVTRIIAEVWPELLTSGARGPVQRIVHRAIHTSSEDSAPALDPTAAKA